MGLDVGISSRRRMLLGLSFIALGLLVPKAVQAQLALMLGDLQRSIITSDTGLLLLASNKLVLMNTLRHAPVIIGTFLFGQGLASNFKLNRLVFFLSLALIPLIYKVISLIYGYQFLFTRSGVMTVFVVLVLHFLTYRVRGIAIKVIIIFLFLSGFDWLEVIPLLGRFDLGGGDVSSAIRVVSAFINADYIMNYVGLFTSLMLITNAVILTKIVVDYYKKTALVETLRKVEMEAVRSRSFQEIKHLVHDLKTPLVTIQGLNEVIGLKVDDPQIKSYTEKVSSSVEKVSSMITEILHESVLRPIHVQEIMDFLKVHLSLEELHARVDIEAQTDGVIYANKHLLCRALINVINNGLQAADKPSGRVQVQALEENGNIVFRVSDNGRGIPRDAMERIWELGYSNGKSTGLGLNFVRKVVDDHHGDIRIASQIGVGTTVKISLPGGEVDNEENSRS
jgi:signal transduction histidine kinase